MNPLIRQPSGRHFLQIPGPTNVPDRVLRAIDAPTIDHRGPEFAALGKEVLAGLKKVFKTEGAVVIYPASGTGAWEAALVNTLSPGDRVLMAETGPFRRAVEASSPSGSGSSSNSCPATGDTASPAEPVEARLARRPRARDQGGVRRAQRNVDRRHQPHRRRPRRDRSRAAPGAVHGRHDLLARLDRLSPRRVGRRRHGRRIAEGADAAAGPVVQCDRREGAGGGEDREAAALVLGLERDARDQPRRILPLHAGDQPALRARCGARHAVRRRARAGVRAPRPAGRGHAAGGRRLGARDPVRRSGRSTAPR